METTTRTPQFSGPSTISPGSPSAGPTGTLHTDDVESGVVRGAGEATDRISAEAAAVGERMRHGADEAASSLRSGTAEMQAASERWLEASRSNVRNRPLTWVALAVAAGALIARLVR